MQVPSSWEVRVSLCIVYLPHAPAEGRSQAAHLPVLDLLTSVPELNLAFSQQLLAQVLPCVAAIKGRLAFVTDETSRRLSDMYGAELLLKRTIVDGLAHTSDHDLSLTYLSLWLHQPYIQSNSRLLLESMLLETGHRAL